MPKQAYAHFIGVGGAGMSGIALVLHQRGIKVTGSDLKESRYSKALVQAGVHVEIGHAAENVGHPEVVVVSSAIPERNPELAAARSRGIEVWPRARMLAHLAGERTTIAVAGTHGKTSTSSMIAAMLSAMDLAPTFLIGGEVDGFDTNAVHGDGEYYVVEADESDGSFVYLHPWLSVVTNVEADHLDHYASLEEITQTFATFMAQTAADGALVVCGDSRSLVELAKSTGRRVVTYGAAEECDLRFVDVAPGGGKTAFRAITADGDSVECSIAVPGVHMVSNACAALASAWVLGLDLERAATSLSTAFTGVRRRFDHVATVNGVTIVDDYAHHPTEVAATLAAAREQGYDRIWALFQPHRYSRTQAFAHDFGASFSAADRVVLMDVYTAGEAPIPGVSGKSILDELLKAEPRIRAAYLPHRHDVVPYLASRVRAGDLVMTMGAGDVTAIGPELALALRDRAPAPLSS